MTHVRAAVTQGAQHRRRARSTAQAQIVMGTQLFGLQGIPLSGLLCPWQLCVWAASGEAVVPNAKDDIVMGHDACANLWGSA